LTEFVKRPQIGAKGLIYIRYRRWSFKSSIDKFFSADDLKKISTLFSANAGDLILIMAGK
jgi:aspartyl-tRNA synthetase